MATGTYARFDPAGEYGTPLQESDSSGNWLEVSLVQGSTPHQRLPPQSYIALATRVAIDALIACFLLFAMTV